MRGRERSLNTNRLGPVLLLLAAVAWAQLPAGDRPAEAGAILPGGRRITPIGHQFPTGPGPFGLAVSASGHRAATADGGPNRYGLTVFDDQAESSVKSLTARSNRANGGEADDEADWHSIFMGLAFDGEEALFASEGESGRIRRVDLRTGKGTPWVELNQGKAADSYSGDLAYDASRHLLFAVDQANFRMAILDARRRTVVSSIRT